MNSLQNLLQRQKSVDVRFILCWRESAFLYVNYLDAFQGFFFFFKPSDDFLLALVDGLGPLWIPCSAGERARNRYWAGSPSRGYKDGIC